MIKRAILSISAIITSTICLAESFEYNGIYYCITDNNKKTASVTYKYYNALTNNKTANTYIGDIQVPSSVVYNNETYQVISVGDDAFNNATELTSVLLPDGTLSIGNGAFKDGINLESIIIPESVITIGNSAFQGCQQLKSIIIPEKVESIGKKAFFDCNNLKEVYCSGCNSYIGYMSFDKTLWYDEQPDGVMYLGNIVYGYKGYTSRDPVIKLKEGTNIIADGAFLGDEYLVDIVIPDGIVIIGNNAFAGCQRLKEITIPSSIKSLGERVFDCQWMRIIKINALDPNQIDVKTNTFKNSHVCNLQIAFKSKNKYLSLSPWNEFNSIITIGLWHYVTITLIGFLIICLFIISLFLKWNTKNKNEIIISLCFMCIGTAIFLGGGIELLLHFVNKERSDLQNRTYFKDGVEYVYLWGGGGAWALCNMGASEPEQMGNQYAWGEITPKEVFSRDNYKFTNKEPNKQFYRNGILYDSNLQKHTKYNFTKMVSGFDNLFTLQKVDDIVQLELGGDWIMPTREDFEKLNKCCVWEFSKVNGVGGFKVYGCEGKYVFRDCYLFFPIGETNVAGITLTVGRYWSSSLYKENDYSAWFFNVTSSSHNLNHDLRYTGAHIRPVMRSN